jgi:anti-anti-sigma factor
MDGSSYQYESRGDVRILRVRGEVDMSNAHAFDLAIRAAQHQQPASIILDLSECRYMDSSGIKVLVATSKSSTVKLQIVLPKASFVRHVFEVTGLDRTFQVFESEQDVVKARRDETQSG